MKEFEKEAKVDVFKIVRLNLPIFFRLGGDEFIVDEIDEYKLEELREKGNFDIELMTCRPIIERNKEENIERFKKMLVNQSNLLLGIYKVNKGQKEVIGRISFYDYNSRNLSTEIGYLLLEEYRNRGIMNTSIDNVLDVLFSICKVNKVYAQTCAINYNSRKLLEKVGFSIDGILRKHHEYNSIFYDDYIYSILQDDYIIRKK